MLFLLSHSSGLCLRAPTSSSFRARICRSEMATSHGRLLLSQSSPRFLGSALVSLFPFPLGSSPSLSQRIAGRLDPVANYMSPWLRLPRGRHLRPEASLYKTGEDYLIVVVTFPSSSSPSLSSSSREFNPNASVWQDLVQHSFRHKSYFLPVMFCSSPSSFLCPNHTASRVRCRG